MPDVRSPEYEETFVKAEIGVYDPIDFEFIESEIREKGPLEIWRIEASIKFVIDVTPCQMEGCDCDETIITLSQIAGFTTLTTGIELEQLLANDSLNAFIDSYLHNPVAYYSSSGERQLVEREIRRHLGFDPMQVYRGERSLDELVENKAQLRKADVWAAHNLQNVFHALLIQRIEFGRYTGQDYRDVFEAEFPASNDYFEFLTRIYDLGFLTSRMIAEHFIRQEIEPIAEKGWTAAQAQERRNEASGRSATIKRHARIAAMLEHIEQLIETNPALRRLGLAQIADLAIEDAVAADPALWSQGKGQRDEYLEEVRSDIRYRHRYDTIKKKTP